MQNKPSSYKSIAYHYTDLNALINILRKNEIVLRATNCLYLNDSNEILEGIESIKRITQKQLQQGAFRSYYITSFSHSKDELSMWGMYASNGSGCAIGFDIYEVLKYYDLYVNCIYGKEKIDENLRNFLKLYENGVKTRFPMALGENTVIEKSRLSAVEETNLFITTCLGAKNKAYCVEMENPPRTDPVHRIALDP